jgi:hypothetical protein
MSDLQKQPVTQLSSPADAAKRRSVKARVETPEKFMEPATREIWIPPAQMDYRLWESTSIAAKSLGIDVHPDLAMWSWFRWHGSFDKEDGETGFHVQTSALLVWDKEFFNGIISQSGKRASICSLFGNKMRDRVAAYKAKNDNRLPFSITPRLRHVWVFDKETALQIGYAVNTENPEAGGAGFPPVDAAIFPRLYHCEAVSAPRALERGEDLIVDKFRCGGYRLLEGKFRIPGFRLHDISCNPAGTHHLFVRDAFLGFGCMIYHANKTQDQLTTQVQLAGHSVA